MLRVQILFLSIAEPTADCHRFSLIEKKGFSRRSQSDAKSGSIAPSPDSSIDAATLIIVVANAFISSPNVEVWHHLQAAPLRLWVKGCSYGNYSNSVRVGGCPAPPCSARFLFSRSIFKASATKASTESNSSRMSFIS